MSTIVALLDTYGIRMQEIECFDAQIKAQVPDLIKARKEAEKEADGIKEAIKSKAKFIGESQAHTLIGKLFQLVWRPGSPKWDDEKINHLLSHYNALVNEVSFLGSDGEALSETYQYIKVADLMTECDGCWQTRKVGKK